MQFTVSFLKVICITAILALIMTTQLVFAQNEDEVMADMSVEALEKVNDAVVNWDFDESAPPADDYLEPRLSPTFGPQGTFTTQLRQRIREVLMNANSYGLNGLSGDEKILRIVDLVQMNPESRDTSPRMEAFVEDESEINEDLLTPEERAAKMVIDGTTEDEDAYTRALKNIELQAPVNIPSNFSSLIGKKKAGLSSDCNNKLCTFLEYQLSCKAQNLGFKKTCAKYFVGFLYTCSDFPAPDQFYNAPSICLNEIIGFFASLVGAPVPGVVPLQTKISHYLNATFYDSNTCGRRCFQLFQNASNDFYNTCGTELTTPNNTKTYPIINALTTFQQFRNQACTGTITPSGAATTCYVGLQKILTAPPPPQLPPGFTINLFDFKCNFIVPQLSIASINQNIATVACQGFAKLGSCGGQAIQMAVQNPVSALGSIGKMKSSAAEEMPNSAPSLQRRLEELQTSYEGFDPAAVAEAMATGDATALGASLSPNLLTVFPPCLLQYWSTLPPATCPLQLWNTANNGSTATQSTYTGWFILYKKGVAFAIPGVCPNPLPLPNVYNKTDVVMTQAVLGKLFTSMTTIANFAGAPYYMGSPLKFMITGYKYYDVQGHYLKPVFNGTTADYSAAYSGNFTYQITLQNVEPNLVGYVQAGIVNLKSYLPGAYGGFPANYPIQYKSGIAHNSEVFELDPHNIVKNGASSVTVSMSVTVMSLFAMFAYLIRW